MRRHGPDEAVRRVRDGSLRLGSFVLLRTPDGERRASLDGVLTVSSGGGPLAPGTYLRTSSGMVDVKGVLSLTVLRRPE